MNGNFFYNFIKTYFNLCFLLIYVIKAGPKGCSKRKFVMDSDPQQTSKRALRALEEIVCDLHEINPIENAFHLVKKVLRKKVIEPI